MDKGSIIPHPPALWAENVLYSFTILHFCSAETGDSNDIS
jgi:hypothetical protein